jgi:hypothetical protein
MGGLEIGTADVEPENFHHGSLLKKGTGPLALQKY